MLPQFYQAMYFSLRLSRLTLLGLLFFSMLSCTTEAERKGPSEPPRREFLEQAGQVPSRVPPVPQDSTLGTGESEPEAKVPAEPVLY